MDADVVRPTLKPKYTDAAPKTIPSSEPKINDRAVISVGDWSGEIYGLKCSSAEDAFGDAVVISEDIDDPSAVYKI